MGTYPTARGVFWRAGGERAGERQLGVASGHGAPPAVLGVRPRADGRPPQRGGRPPLCARLVP